MPPQILRQLLAKYTQMRALRTRALSEQPDDPREDLRSLAREFPGSLREIDRLPLATIEARIAALEAAVAGAEPPAWAALIAAFHGWLRVGLALKRRFGRDLDAAASFVSSHYEPAPGDPSREALAPQIPALLAPPSGRLSRWVLEHLGRAAARDHEELERWLFTG